MFEEKRMWGWRGGGGVNVIEGGFRGKEKKNINFYPTVFLSATHNYPLLLPWQGRTLTFWSAEDSFKCHRKNQSVTPKWRAWHFFSANNTRASAGEQKELKKKKRKQKKMCCFPFGIRTFARNTQGLNKTLPAFLDHQCDLCVCVHASSTIFTHTQIQGCNNNYRRALTSLRALK